MTGSVKSRNEVPFEASLQIAAAPLQSILCTQELRNRPSRPPEYEKENRALAALARTLADSPRTIMWEIARDCGSARTKGPVHEARSLS